MGRTTSGRKPVTIAYVSWRDGRPRFQPGKALRDLGYKGRDLRHEDGRWFSEGEATDWSNTFAGSLKARPTDPAEAKKPKRGGRKRYAITLKELVKNYVKDRTKLIAAGAINLEQRTVYYYDKHARYVAKISPTLWNTRSVDSIKRHEMKKLHQTAAVAHGLYVAAQVIRSISAIISWGMDEEGCLTREMNPCHRLRIPQGSPRLRIGTAQEITALVAAADHLGWPFIGDGVVLGVFTGQRQGDRLALLNDGRDDQKRYLFRQSKTGALVAIKPTAWLTERMEASKGRRRFRNAVYPHALMDERTWLPLTGDRGERYRRLFERVREAAAEGIEDGQGNWIIKPVPSVSTLRDQDLRDTAVTYMARGGATIPAICAVTGHSLQSATTILRHYLEINPELADEGIDAMVSYWERQLEQQNQNSE